MGLYVSQEEIKLRVYGKIRFTEDLDNPENQDKMPIALLRKLIDEAEGQVEADLLIRYSAPFQTVDGQAFDKLPRPTRSYLRTMCELMAIVRLMETDFGRATGTAGEEFAKMSQKRYDAMLKTLVEVKDGSFNIFVRPPLEGLMLGYHNEEADHGFRGRVLTVNTTADGDYPSKQINDPSEDFVNGVIDE